MDRRIDSEGLCINLPMRPRIRTDQSRLPERRGERCRVVVVANETVLWVSGGLAILFCKILPPHGFLSSWPSSNVPLR